MQLIVGGAELEVWRSPASAMPEERVASLMPDLRELVCDAFPRLAPSVGDEDLVHHCLGPTFGAYQLVEGRLRAMTAAEVFDLRLGRTLYFSLSDVHSSLRGRGLYEQMLLLRVAIGRNEGCQWWATRTQSPIVAHSFAKFGCYPWADDEAMPSLATQVAAMLYDSFDVLGRREGQVFEPKTGVLHAAYPSSLYKTIPTVEDPVVQSHFNAYVDRDLGDALLLLGRLEVLLETLSPRCRARFGISFDQLCEVLKDL
jgi:hypothetical protein